MRKPHPSYESFVKEQYPKYGETFIEWYAKNHKINNEHILSFIDGQTNHVFRQNDEFQLFVYYRRDYFTKKLQLCSNLLNTKMHDIGQVGMTYGLDKLADIMDLYEELIQYISTQHNIGVCSLPSGLYSNGSTYTTGEHTFRNLAEFTEYSTSGEVVVYYFKVLEDFSLLIRMTKREPLTRNVLFEK